MDRDVKFETPYSNVLIYVFGINDEIHRGCLKIGKATIKTTDSQIAELKPNCSLLNRAAKVRIDQYMTTSGTPYILKYTTLALRRKKDEPNVWEYFSDSDVHSVLKHSGLKKQVLGKSREWFKTDLDTVIRAIDAVKQNRSSLTPGEITNDNFAIEFRPEQEEAIMMAITRFKSDNRILWNAKMRFGKTLCALEVVKREHFKKTIIITHRPVVDNSWNEDFYKIFSGDTNYYYCAKGTSDSVVQQHCIKNEPFIYFVSMQDLRGSSIVGGKFNKRDITFSINWDCLIVDEAHEGTQTYLGDEVLKEIVKDERYGKTKQLYLSGTPFNLVEGFEDKDVYTWDYVMEQRAKHDWNINHELDSNPYENLPELKIYTYDLGKDIKGYIETEDKAFNFREFFRTWTGQAKYDRTIMPANVHVGDFVHEKDVKSFINLLVKESDDSNYPFSRDDYRKYFRHSLWVLPGVREARAFSKLLQEHPVFNCFSIANVAGDGDEEDDSSEALGKVYKAITDHPEHTYSITLTCGRLTTGVTIKPWTAVMMLAGSYSVSASNYLQTIFRVQSPANINGMVKDKCYVFDFAPDRTLKMVAEAGKLGTKPGVIDKPDVQIGELLNFCPVISVNGSEMKAYNVNAMLQQIKRVYAEKVAQNGFDDTKLYNDELLRLDNVAIKEFEKLKKIVGKTKATAVKDITINDLGLTNEEREKIEETRKKPKKELSEEEKKLLEEHRKALEERGKAISILRSISIRIPLLIYGAQCDFEDDITIEGFADMIDNESWKEFMPNGVTKEVFNSFVKYYDKDIFIAAGKTIRRKVKAADSLPPLERIRYIADVFATFKNPDKETVLTPWRVVNMHMADCLGGYDFYDKTHRILLEQPRFVDQGKVTAQLFKSNTVKILEINSKTGLYPLYVAYAIYANKIKEYPENEWTLELQQEVWDKVLSNNIFVICKTEMAKFITNRTLLGYRRGNVNSHYFVGLINQFKNKSEQILRKITSTNYWKVKGDKDMKFDAIIGNPPYQIMDGGAQASALPVYNYFVENAIKMNPDYISIIMPSRWMTGGRGLDTFREEMINDKHVVKLFDYLDATQCFSNVEIKGGVCYFLRDSKVESKCCVTTIFEDGAIVSSNRYLKENDGDEFFVRDSRLISIRDKVWKDTTQRHFDDLVSSMRPYGFRGDVFFDIEKYNLPEFSNVPVEGGYSIIGLDDKQKRTVKYLAKDYPIPKRDCLDDYKIFVSRNYGVGKMGELPASPIFAKPGMLCTETFVQIGPFRDETEMSNCFSYMKTKLFRLLVGIKKHDQGASKAVYVLVPMQDFSKAWTDEELYKKYGLSLEEKKMIETLVKN